MQPKDEGCPGAPMMHAGPWLCSSVLSYTVTSEGIECDMGTVPGEKQALRQQSGLWPRTLGGNLRTSFFYRNWWRAWAMKKKIVSVLDFSRSLSSGLSTWLGHLRGWQLVPRGVFQAREYLGNGSASLYCILLVFLSHRASWDSRGEE